MSRMKSTIFWTTVRLTHRNWSLLDDSGGGEGGCWLMCMEGVGVIWTVSGSGIADQTQRHDLWDIVDNVFLVVDHITHSLWSMKTTGCLKEINRKSIRNTGMWNKPKGIEWKIEQTKFSKNELFYTFEMVANIWVLHLLGW